MSKFSLLILIVILFSFISCKNNSSTVDLASYTGWGTYAGSKDGSRYSFNSQITLENVTQLQVAWTYSSHDKDTGNHSQNQCNPIMVDGIL